MRALGEGDRSGSRKYDFVPTSSAFIYRCAISGCVSPHNPKGMGMPINANGIKEHVRCHITRDHVGLGREVHIRVETRNGRMQRHTVPRITTTKIRKRHGVTVAEEGPSQRDSDREERSTQQTTDATTEMRPSKNTQNMQGQSSQKQKAQQKPPPSESKTKELTPESTNDEDPAGQSPVTTEEDRENK